MKKRLLYAVKIIKKIRAYYFLVAGLLLFVLIPLSEIFNKTDVQKDFSILAFFALLLCIIFSTLNLLHDKEKK